MCWPTIAAATTNDYTIMGGGFGGEAGGEAGGEVVVVVVVVVGQRTEGHDDEEDGEGVGDGDERRDERRHDAPQRLGRPEDAQDPHRPRHLPPASPAADGRIMICIIFIQHIIYYTRGYA